MVFAGAVRCNIEIAHHATGVNAGPGNQQPSTSHTISPGVTLQSTHLTFSYAPSFVWYTEGPYNDSVNHSLSASAWIGYDKWRFTLSHSYGWGSQPLVETAQQTDSETHSTGLSANYQHSERTSLDFSLSQSIQNTSEFNSSRNWSSMNWLNYVLTSKTTVGIGAGGGYSDVETGADSTYQSFQARINWVPTQKISAGVNGGIEVRQFLGETAADDSINPIFGANISYRPWHATTFGLSANRTIGTSLFADQITETTSLNASFGQRFFQRLNWGVSAGYSISDYQSTSQLVAVDRSDTIKSISTSLSMGFLKRASASVAYSHSINDSNLEGYSFTNDQITASLGYSF